MEFRRSSFASLDASSASANEPENQREHRADHNAGDDGKVEDGVLAADRNVAGQAAERQVEAASQQQHRAQQKDDAAKEHQNFSQVGHQIFTGRDAAADTYAAFSALRSVRAARTSAFSMDGGFDSRSPALAMSAAAMRPFRCA